jgi:alkanesulfonate monooxygenase SsuD/methylene tetrahydromethanopterin reductase-like flavin-dependent oxidoreductase (luciferase family)
MEFGYHHPSFRYPDTDAPIGEALIDQAQFVEDAGFTWFTLWDHLWQLQFVDQRDGPFMECYTGLSAVAAATDTMELSALVTCPHYRNPAMLAKTVASLDTLSNGRAMLAIGAGWYEDEYDAAGVEYPPADKRIRQCRDVITLCRTAWNEPSPVDYDGEYYDLDGLYLNPKPDDIPVLVGGGGEQLTLRLTAEYADRWNGPGDPETYEHKLDVLREHCEREGTDYDAIEKTATLTTVIRDTTEAAHEAYEQRMAPSPQELTPRDGFRGLVGTASEVAELVATYRELGVDTLQIQPLNDRETIERFADDVMPDF